MKYKRRKHTRNGRLSKRRAKTQHTEAELRRAEKQAAYHLVYLIACGINEVPPDKERVEKMDLERVHQLSLSLSLNALAYLALESAYDGHLPSTSFYQEWEREKDHAIYKNFKFDTELRQVTEFLERERIWYMPLKGAVLQDFYPQAGMRQMCDVDILFDRQYETQVHDWFLGRGYRARTYQTGKEDSYTKEPFFNFEMHGSLFFNPSDARWTAYYENVKDWLLPDGPDSCRYHFSGEDFYIYLMTHACKHHRNRGTGLRTLLDAYVYLENKGADLNWTYVEQELSVLGLKKYEEQVRTLSRKIFGDPDHFSVSALSAEERRLLDSYLFVGTYGTLENGIRYQLRTIQPEKQKKFSIKTKFTYVWHRLFPDIEVFKKHYPFFNRHKWLLPVGYVWRWIYNGIIHFGYLKKEVRALAKL